MVRVGFMTWNFDGRWGSLPFVMVVQPILYIRLFLEIDVLQNPGRTADREAGRCARSHLATVGREDERGLEETDGL
jgi:hypothetical protein